MKIAVPYSEDGTVFQHFGKTTAFKYYEVKEDGTMVPGEVAATDGIGHEALAGLLKQNGVDVVICGGLGEGMKNALAEAGVKLVSGASGNADEAVKAYLAGELTSSDANCHHEEEDHECGHECGHGCGGCGGCGDDIDWQPIMEGKNVGKRVRVHYEGTFNDGSVFDSSYDRGEPLEFLCGVGQMIRGFDRAVADMEQGETVNIHLMPEDAYGMPDPRAVMSFKISDLPGSENLSVGQRVHLRAENGQAFPVRVTAKDEENITLDANHEMAGKELNFKIELVEIL